MTGIILVYLNTFENDGLKENGRIGEVELKRAQLSSLTKKRRKKKKEISNPRESLDTFAAEIYIIILAF